MVIQYTKEKKSFDFFYELPFVFYHKNKRHDAQVFVSGFLNQNKLMSLDYIDIGRVEFADVYCSGKIIETDKKIEEIIKQNLERNLINLKQIIGVGFIKLMQQF